jgi:RimJ/RimL family protein N-acetyltransferase
MLHEAVVESTEHLIPAINQVEIHHDKANVRSAAIPRRLGCQFLEEEPQAIRSPGQVGIGCVWICTRHDWMALAP